MISKKMFLTVFNNFNNIFTSIDIMKSIHNFSINFSQSRNSRVILFHTIYLFSLSVIRNRTTLINCYWCQFAFNLWMNCVRKRFASLTKKYFKLRFLKYSIMNIINWIFWNIRLNENIDKLSNFNFWIMHSFAFKFRFYCENKKYMWV